MRARVIEILTHPKQIGACKKGQYPAVLTSRGFFKKFVSFLYRKNHNRQLESLQASLETEVKAKSDLVIISRFIYSTLLYSLSGEEFSSNIFYLLSNEHYLYLWFIKRVE